jgi:c(7)-type cytochrome triheme protein
MTHPARALSLLTLLLLTTPAALSAGQEGSPEKPRLPADIVLDQKVGQDGAVVFRHSTHTAFTGLQCGGCHPAPFRMLKPERSFDHETMNAGRLCGACHDGRGAFSTADDKVCGRCHPGFGAPASPYPPDVPLKGSGGSPGPVLFHHATHATPAAACADCHPRPFMRPAAGSAAGAAPVASHDTCGVCHNGQRSFVMDDETSCGRCHISQGGTR